MRRVTITKEDFEQTIQVDGKSTRLTGSDTTTGELVKFKLSDPALVDALIALANRDGSVEISVADFQIISVEPVRGEWDSPGTSPEEGDDDGHRAR